MPTLTIDSKHSQVSLGNVFGSLRQYTGPASYTTGGDAFVAGDVKMGYIYDIWFASPAINSAGAIRHLVYDGTNNTIRWYDNADPHAEIANGTDLSDFNVKILVLQG